MDYIRKRSIARPRHRNHAHRRQPRAWGFGFPLPFPFDGRHSDQLRAVERYARSEDGERLLLSVTLTDPWALREPVTLKKVWAWAPDQEISPHEDCERPAEFQRGVSQP